MHFIQIEEKSQLQSIQSFLLSEKEDLGHSFICNFNIIEEAFEKKSIFGVISNDKVLAFITYNKINAVRISISIAVTDYRLRRKGIGKMMFEHFVQYIIDNNDYFDVGVINLFCEPSSSESFWRSLGFIDFPPISKIPYGNSPHLHKIIRNYAFNGNKKDLSIKIWNSEYYSFEENDFECIPPDIEICFDSDDKREQSCTFYAHYDCPVEIETNERKIRCKLKYSPLDNYRGREFVHIHYFDIQDIIQETNNHDDDQY